MKIRNCYSFYPGFTNSNSHNNYILPSSQVLIPTTFKLFAICKFKSSNFFSKKFVEPHPSYAVLLLQFFTRTTTRLQFQREIEKIHLHEELLGAQAHISKNFIPTLLLITATLVSIHVRKQFGTFPSDNNHHHHQYTFRQRLHEMGSIWNCTKMGTFRPWLCLQETCWNRSKQNCFLC